MSKLAITLAVIYSILLLICSQNIGCAIATYLVATTDILAIVLAIEFLYSILRQNFAIITMIFYSGLYTV